MPVTQTFNTIADLQAYIDAHVTVNNNKEISGQQMLNILRGVLGFISPSLQQQLIVQVGAGQSVGGSDTGETFAAGTTLESVIRDILIKSIHPTYVLPTINLTSSIAILDYEVGSIISPILNLIYNQNDGGAIVSRGLKKNNTLIASTFPFSDNNVLVDENGLFYQGNLSYAQGAVKNNNLGQPDSIGQIQAGAVLSNTILYKGYRKMFWDFPASIPTDSASVRALTNSFLNPIVGSQITINIPQGATRVVFAYPATLEDPQSVKYVEANIEVKDIFTKTTASVEGAGAYTPTSYKIFTYTPVEPYPSAVTYIVKI